MNHKNRNELGDNVVVDDEGVVSVRCGYDILVYVPKDNEREVNATCTWFENTRALWKAKYPEKGAKKTLVEVHVRESRKIHQEKRSLYYLQRC